MAPAVLGAGVDGGLDSRPRGDDGFQSPRHLRSDCLALEVAGNPNAAEAVILMPRFARGKACRAWSEQASLEEKQIDALWSDGYRV